MFNTAADAFGILINLEYQLKYKVAAMFIFVTDYKTFLSHTFCDKLLEVLKGGGGGRRRNQEMLAWCLK